MEKGTIRVICGPGSGKTACALGYGLIGASRGNKVIVIQFLKGELEEPVLETLKRLEPEVKLFRFEKAQGVFESLSEEQKKEEADNIRNGFNFAKKVMTTGECRVLILDEILGLVDQKLVSTEELVGLITTNEELSVILTGRVCPEELKKYVDVISYVDKIQVDNSRE